MVTSDFTSNKSKLRKCIKMFFSWLFALLLDFVKHLSASFYFQFLSRSSVIVSIKSKNCCKISKKNFFSVNNLDFWFLFNKFLEKIFENHVDISRFCLFQSEFLIGKPVKFWILYFCWNSVLIFNNKNSLVFSFVKWLRLCKLVNFLWSIEFQYEHSFLPNKHLEIILHDIGRRIFDIQVRKQI